MMILTLTADLTGYDYAKSNSEAMLIEDSVTELRPEDTPDNPFWYTFKVQCTSCREVHPNFVNVSRFVSVVRSVPFHTI